MKSWIVLFLLFTPSLFAQKRYIVSPRDEFIPVKQGESVVDVMRKTKEARTVANNCGTRYTLGFHETQWGSPYGARHKEVIAAWFVAFGGGTIDSLFFQPLGNIGAYDSSVTVRIMRSNIYPGHGPGFGPYRAPCAPWGYYSDVNDSDQGITPFRDEATDTNWISTAIGDSSSFDPFGDVLWGHSGVPVRLKENERVTLSLTDFDAPLHVQRGDGFFVTIRIKSLNRHPIPADEPTEFQVHGMYVSGSDGGAYPSRLWKFYEHESSASSCRGIPLSEAPKGWYAQGGLPEDSLNVAFPDIWFSFTPTENVPPDIQSESHLVTSLDPSARTVWADILDCDFEVPSRAGAKVASLKWSINGVVQPDIPMSYVGGLTWTGIIPAEPVGSEVKYKVHAEDSTGKFSESPPVNYRIVSRRTGYALLDSGSCQAMSIAGNSANVIPPESFYLPPGAPSNASALNDGSAGPFDMGSNMPLFGDVGRYLWIGVNGGVAISKSAFDTVDVNANGLFPSSWTFPNSGPIRHGGRSDPEGKLLMPGNFFAPLWGDIWRGDSVNGAICGHIRVQKGFGGDSCKVIAEWDSIGGYRFFEGPQCDELTFRVVFNKCDGTITYQYDDIGTNGQDTTALIGFQADSTVLTFPSPAICKDPPYLFVNQDGYPFETRPYSGACFSIYQAPVTTRLAGWNLVSPGVIPPKNRAAKKDIYPDAISPAFRYGGLYVSDDTISPGRGYWIKVVAASCAGAPGALLHDLVDTIRIGWNLIGTIGFPVSTASIGPGGGVSLSSGFYGYDGSYHTTSILKPGCGYWVKASAPGTLSISGGVSAAEPKLTPSTNLVSLNRITIADNEGRSQSLYLGTEESVKEPLSSYELPPAMPGFDARFASGRMIETYPPRQTGAAIHRYPIHIEAESYPLTFGWNITDASNGVFSLANADKKIARKVLSGAGSITVSDANVKDFYVELSGTKLPSQFALHQNYPNPFNPATQIRFSIRDAGRVTLKVFDDLGREVAVLVNEEKEPGEYLVNWNAENFASGMYFYELKAGSFRDVKKLVLVR